MTGDMSVGGNDDRGHVRGGTDDTAHVSGGH